MSLTLLAIFVPTFFFVSLTPGMCMLLALTLGMSIGVRRSMYMMYGELLGITIVAIGAALGVATLMLKLPQVFDIFKLLGASYLIWLGYQMWRSRGRLVINEGESQHAQATASQLAFNGFITAIANPKGWAFMVSLLPSFIDPQQPMLGQLTVIVILLAVLEFIAMMLYATGGKALRHLLLNKSNVKLLNRISGTLMIGVGIWLAMS